MYVNVLRWLHVFSKFWTELFCWSSLQPEKSLSIGYLPFRVREQDRHHGLQWNAPRSAFKLLLFSTLILFSRRWRVIKRFSKPSPALPVPFRPPLLWCHLEIPPLWSSIWKADSADNWCRGRNGGSQRQQGAFNSSLLQHHSLCTIPNSSAPSD